MPSWLTLGQFYFVFTSCYLLSNDYLGKRLSGSKSVVNIDQAQKAEGRLLRKHLTAFRSVPAVENRIIPCPLLIRPQSVLLRSAVPEQNDYVTFNLLKPNDIYIRRTEALTSRRYILNIYSTNIHTEYFKHAA